MRTNSLRLLSLVFGFAACSSSGAAPDGGGGGAAGASAGLLGCTPIKEAALAGCRASDEPSCDCAHVDVGIDPCAAPLSCACKCAAYLADVKACPAP
jgi:hypothetical protein